jgi:DNA-binding HxlR family transcriptional regulator
VAHALDLVGERWGLLVVRELLLGPKRFTDLRAGLPAVSPNVLAQRLREFEHAGVVGRHRLPPPASAQVYGLTAWGLDLEPVLVTLGRWGLRSPTWPHDAELSIDAHVLSLKLLFDASSARGLRFDLMIKLDDGRVRDSFRVEVDDGTLGLARGELSHPDATLDTDTATFHAVLRRRRTIGEACRIGSARVVGAEHELDRFLDLFPPPRTWPAASAPELSALPQSPPQPATPGARTVPS